MAIQSRRGNEANFVPGKMVAGEWGVVLDSKKVYCTFAPGDVKQMMTVEDAVVQLEAAVEEATELTSEYATNAYQSAVASQTSAVDSEGFAQASADSATEALASENNAKASETASQNYSVDAEAWAVGQRNGTDVASTDATYENNSKYYSIVAKNLNDDSQKALEDAREVLEAAQQKITAANFSVDLNTGILMYNDDSSYTFYINETTGELIWGVAS